MSKKTFLDLPAEVRVKIYRYYFGETKDEVSLHFDAACELVLPCRTTDHFDHLRIRAKRYGLTYQQMCSNPVISLLLTSHAVFQEALPSLYEHKIFNYGFDLKTLTPLRLTMKQRLKQLVLDGSVGASELVCLLEYKGEKDTDYLNDDLSVHSHLERFVGSNVGTTGLWRQVVCGMPSLRHLAIKRLMDVECLALCRYWASHASFQLESTRIFVMTTNPYIFPSGPRTAQILKALPDYDQIARSSDSTAIPAVTSLTLPCHYGGLEGEALLKASFAGCRFVHAETLAPAELGRVLKKYEMIFPKKRVALQT